MGSEIGWTVSKFLILTAFVANRLSGPTDSDHPSDGRQQIRAQIRLGDKLVRAGRQRGRSVLFGVQHRQCDYAHFRYSLTQAGNNLETGQIGHRQIQQNDIRTQLLGSCQRAYAAYGSSDEDHLIVLLEEAGCYAQQGRVVVHEQNRDGAQCAYLTGVNGWLE